MSKALQILTPDECTKLLDYFTIVREGPLNNKKNKRDYLITLLMLDAGLRVGEVVQLKVHDLFFGDHEVSTLIVRADIAKRNTERCVPVSERLREAIRQMYNRHRGWQTASPDDWVFRRTQFSDHLTARTVQLMISLASYHALGRKIHPHILRHTFATRLMRKTNIRVVQQLLGHKSISSTQIYTHPNSTDLQDAIKSIG